MASDISSYVSIVNAVPWGGFKMLVIDPITGSGSHNCNNNDTINLAGYFSKIVGAFGMLSNTIAACSWSALVLTTGTANLTSIVVFGY